MCYVICSFLSILLRPRRWPAHGRMLRLRLRPQQRLMQPRCYCTP
jgi:hypothetical protein